MPNLRPISYSLATILALVLAAPIAPAQDGKRYNKPDFGKKLFAREALLLETQEVASTVTALAALASNFPSAAEIDHQLRAKALAIALRLDGTHPGALAANASLSKGELPADVPDFNTLAEVAGRLWAIAAFLESPEKGKDESVVQFCLVDIAREIDPSNLSESNRYPTSLKPALFPGWSSVLGDGGNSAFVFPDNTPPPVVTDPDKPAAPDNPPVAPTNPTRTAQGAYRSIVASGNTPAIARIHGDLKAGGGTAAMAIIYSDEDGDTGQPLNDHRDSLVSSLTELQGSWPEDGGVIVLTVGADQAGDEALLLPSAILADSLMRERELDPRTLALGFVAPEGNLIRVTRLYQRLRSYKSIDVDTILVPEENLPELQDMALLDELAPFFRHQIILVSSLKEAVAIAAAKRDENFAKSLNDFKLVQEVAKDSVLTEMTGFTIVKSTLGNITKLNPKHASASILLEHGTGKLPEHLTRNGSLAALYRSTGPVVTALQTKGSADRPTVLAAYEAVTKIQKILDPETVPLGKMMSDLLKDIGNFASMPSKDSSAASKLKAKIFDTWNSVREEYTRLKNSDD